MTLSPKQIDSYNHSDARLNVWIGAVRSGKTYSSILKLIKLIKHGPEGSCMIIGVNRDTIQRNVLLELYKFLGFPCPGTKTTETKLYGRNVYFVGAHDEGSVRRIQGSTLSFAYVDEVTCIPQPFFTMLLSRLSVKGAQLLCTGNPEGPSHWFKKNYIDRQEELDLAHWHFTLDDNPSLDPAYVENLKKEYTGAWYQRLILGLWVANSGLIYDRFDDLNLYTESKNNPIYYIMGIDYGTSDATAAVICAVTPNKWPQMCIEKEFYYDSRKSGQQLTDDELGDRLVEFIGYRNLRAIYVDPSAASMKAELRRRNLPVLDAKNDVIPGIRTVSKFIAGKNLVVHKSCTGLIEELQSYLWDPKATDRGFDKPLHDHSHFPDSLRYCIFSAFPQGEFSHPDEHLTIEQIKQNVYGDTFNPIGGNSMGGYY